MPDDDVVLLAELELLARYVLKIAPTTGPEDNEVLLAKRILARRFDRPKKREELPPFNAGL